MLINDGDEAIDQIELIVSLAQQCDSLEPHEAHRLRAEIAARLQCLRSALLADEATIRATGDGCNVPHALTEIERARSALFALQAAVDSRLGDAKTNALENASPARWAS
jgi:hypothetical protein